jgi:hypothetical protein
MKLTPLSRIRSLFPPSTTSTTKNLRLILISILTVLQPTMSSTSSYHSFPSNASTSSTTIRRKPLPTASHVPRRKSKHRWHVGRLFIAALEPKDVEPPPLEFTNTAVGNDDDKWGDEYSESMDQRVLEPIFRNGWSAFELGSEAGRLGGEISEKARLIRNLEGTVCVCTDSGEEMEEEGGGSGDTIATSVVRRVHFAGDTMEVPMDRGSKRGGLRGILLTKACVDELLSNGT